MDFTFGCVSWKLWHFDVLGQFLTQYLECALGVLRICHFKVVSMKNYKVYYKEGNGLSPKS